MTQETVRTPVIHDESPFMIRHILHVRHLPDAFLLLTAVGAAALGITFLAFPDVYTRVPSFRLAFAIIDPWLWALALVIPAAWISAAVALRRSAAMWPCFVLAIVFVGFALSVVPTVGPGGGIPSGIIAYSMIGCYAGLVGILARAWDTLAERA